MLRGYKNHIPFLSVLVTLLLLLLSIPSALAKKLLGSCTFSLPVIAILYVFLVYMLYKSIKSNSLPVREYMALFLACITYSAIVYASFFYVAPKFPIINSNDLLAYSSAAYKLTLSANPTVYTMIYALSGSLPPLVLVRLLLVLAGMLTILSIYDFGAVIINRKTGLLSAHILALTNPFIYGVLHISGLLSNALGAALALNAASITLAPNLEPRKLKLITAIIAWLLAIGSHLTSLIPLLAVAVYSAANRKDKDARVIVLAVLTIGVILGAARIEQISRLPKVIEERSFVSIYPSDKISLFLLSSKITAFLGHLYTYGGLAYLVFTVIALASGIALLKNGKTRVAVPLVWVLGLYLGSIVNPNVWRIATLSSIPLTPLMVTPAAKIAETNTRNLIVAGAILGVMIGSSAWPIEGVITLRTQIMLKEKQLAAYQAVKWALKHLPPNARVAGMSTPEIRYANYLGINKKLSVIGDFYGPPGMLCAQLERRGGADYLVVWAKVHENSTYLIDYYLASPNFKPVYHNSEYYVFKILNCTAEAEKWRQKLAASRP